MPFRQKPLQVAVAVIKNADGRILLSLRDESLHQGGLWEFPGGKIEVGETPLQALQREIKEELDINVITATPLITVLHQYSDLSVQLLVFLVENFTGIPKSCEGQPYTWAAADDLPNYAFPDANRPIITAARLPSHYAILDDADPALLTANLRKILNRGVKLVQARLKNLPADTVKAFLRQVYPLCRRHGAMLLLNSAVKSPDGDCNGPAMAFRIARETGIDGIHLTSLHLLQQTLRPEAIQWLSASCHTIEELRYAQQINADFAVLAPVLTTQTHPGVKPMGWQHFSVLAAGAKIPVYALGGMTEDCLSTARLAGGQGIAAIRAFL